MQRYALVTGGNRGIGFEVCKRLVEQGKPVIVAARDPAQGQQAVAELQRAAKEGTAIECMQLDAADPHSISRLAEEVKGRHDQQIDLLVNNAGMLDAEAWARDVFDRTMHTNFFGPVALTRQLLPHLAEGALVIMVSSGLGKYYRQSADYQQAIKSASTLDALKVAAVFNDKSPMPTEGSSYAPTYCVSKCLLNRAVQLMTVPGPDAARFRARGVSVVSTCPGWCSTRMGGMQADRSAKQGADSVLWPWLHWQPQLAGSFTRDGGELPW